jgi:hypothetical protein
MKHKNDFLRVSLSLSVSGRSWTLDLRIMSQLFYLCTTNSLYYKNMMIIESHLLRSPILY